jgi:hypothetical protein
VTLIDIWPANVDETNGNGLRIAHHEDEEPLAVKVAHIAFDPGATFRQKALIDIAFTFKRLKIPRLGCP